MRAPLYPRGVATLDGSAGTLVLCHAGAWTVRLAARTPHGTAQLGTLTAAAFAAERALVLVSAPGAEQLIAEFTPAAPPAPGEPGAAYWVGCSDCLAPALVPTPYAALAP